MARISLHQNGDHCTDVVWETSVLKSNKANFPKSGASKQLKVYLHSVHSDVLGSCKKHSETKKKYNLLPNEREALKSLKDAQSKGIITIKECDKGGGTAVMNTQDYIAEINKQLTATFQNPNKTKSNFYVQVTQDVLKKKQKDIMPLRTKI